jgi:molybdopterin/thiamine biosynthesis adenylyltransferase
VRVRIMADSTDARSHVNRLCQAAKVPLIESGTAGYMGQVQPHLNVSFACVILDCAGPNHTVSPAVNHARLSSIAEHAGRDGMLRMPTEARCSKDVSRLYAARHA